MTAIELARMAKRMRDAQRAYFRARMAGAGHDELKDLLAESKSAELSFDLAVRNLLNPPPLFPQPEGGEG